METVVIIAAGVIVWLVFRVRALTQRVAVLEARPFYTPAAERAPAAEQPDVVPQAEAPPTAATSEAETTAATAAPSAPAEPPPPAPELQPAAPSQPDTPKDPWAAAAAAIAARSKTEAPPTATVPPKAQIPPKPPRAPVSWERMLGVHLPVWGGAIMLLFAGYFLVNWAIEAGLFGSIFTEPMRVALCALGAIALVGAAFAVKARKIANGDEIASALAAAGIALGYGTMFLAASVFDLVPGAVALVGAAVVTAAAIAISARFGQRVMLVGLLGGYLSPFFVWGPGSSSTLIALYVAVLMAVSLYAIRRNGWWKQSVVAIVAPALWAFVLVASKNAPVIATLYLLLAAIPAAVALLPLRQDPEALPQRQRLVFFGVVAAAINLALGGIAQSYHLPFGLAQALLVAGLLALLLRDATAWRKAWIASLVSSLLMLASWIGPDLWLLLVATLALAALHLAALAVQYRAGLVPNRRAFEIAGLSAIAFIILITKLDGWLGARDVPWMWAGIAAALAAIFALLSLRLAPARAGFAAGANAMLSLALGLVLDPGLYALVAALQATGLALLYSRLWERTLLVLHVAYAGLYLVLLIAGQAMYNSAMLFSTDWMDAGLADFVPVTSVYEQPITLLLIPGLLAVLAATALARVAYGIMGRVLDMMAVLLVAAAIHFLILPTIPLDIERQAFVIGSFWFNALAALGLAALFAGMRLNREGLVRAGLALSVVVATVMFVWAMLPIFRFWPTIDTPGLPVLNAGLTALGLPAALLLATAALARKADQLQLARGLAVFGGLAGLLTILVLIRQAIHGPTLQGDAAVIGQVELYLYSAGMLLYGFVLLWAGAKFSSVALRVGSLVVVLATIGKVFFYDVGGLEGLWRVGSFLGMGVALLAVSWFYGRHVFHIGPGGAQASKSN